MAIFRKREDCPASQQLLSYQLGDLETEVSREIGRHLGLCEFCSSEVNFYEKYPAAADFDEVNEPAEMPKPLFELAEALLDQGRGTESIARIMRDFDKV
jgi:hypothetical protein